MKRFLLALALFPLIVAGGGVDVDGAPLAPSSRLGDVDGENSTIADVFNAANTNAYTKAETDARIVELAPTPGDYLNVSNRAMSAVQTESDPTVPAWAKASTPPPSMTTNAVREIVTGEVPILSDWTFSGDTAYSHHLNMRHTPASDAGGGTHEKWSLYESQFLLAEMEAGEFATNLYFSAAGITATRTALGSTNALGLARLVDLPPLTNDMPSMIASAAQSAISTNNPAFVEAVTNCPVVIATADGTTLGEFGEYGTLGALLSALAAAITWLKANKANSADVTAALALKADATSLPYALVDVPVSSTAYAPQALFQLKFSIDGTPHTVAYGDSGLYVSAQSTGYWLTWNDGTDTWLIARFEGDGSFDTEDSDVDSGTLRFGADEHAPTSADRIVLPNTAPLTDRAINAVSLTAAATLAFPAQTAGKARDFVVRLTLTETNDVVPSVTFPADVAYETEGGEWPDLTEAGTYIVRLTEVPTESESETARLFLQCSSAVEDATPPSAGGAE